MAHMKKTILLTLAVVMFASLAGAAQKDNDAAVSAALDKIARQDDAPRWKSSLGDIESVTAVLVETNRKLTQEAQSLAAQQTALTAAIAAQRQKNSEQQVALASRREEINAPVRAGAEKQQLSQEDAEAQGQIAALTAARARLRAIAADSVAEIIEERASNSSGASFASIPPSCSFASARSSLIRFVRYASIEGEAEGVISLCAFMIRLYLVSVAVCTRNE